jgi:hypothetical protein
MFMNTTLPARRSADSRAIRPAQVGFPSPSGRDPLLEALGLAPGLESDVAAVALAYQPHVPVPPEVDAAADRLAAACGGRTEESAARVCVLVQAHAAVPPLIRPDGRSVRGRLGRVTGNAYAFWTGY